MKTLKVYFDDTRKNYQIVTPTEAFYKDVKGEPISPDWDKLAKSLCNGYWSFIENKFVVNYEVY